METCLHIGSLQNKSLTRIIRIRRLNKSGISAVFVSLSIQFERIEAFRACSSAWLERTPDKREVGSSSLPRPTILLCLVGFAGQASGCEH